MRFRCARCDFQSEDPAYIDGHTTGDGAHPRCILCRKSLRGTPDRAEEIQTCGKCLGHVRADLLRIVDLYALLPATLGRLGSNYPRSDARSHGDGSDRLAGGEALVMLSDGAERRWGAENEGHPSDPPVVPLELWTWADDWHSLRHEDEEPPVTVVELVRWLGRERCEWAARWHPAFDEFVSDVRRILAALVRATGTSDRPERGAPCFKDECRRDDGSGIPLERKWEDDGLADTWQCPKCKRTYLWPEYWLAVRSAMRQRQEAADTA